MCELRALEDLLDAGERLNFDVHHGLGEPHVKPMHSQCVCPYLHLSVPVTLLAVVGLVSVSVGCSDTIGCHLWQGMIVSF